MPAGRAAEAPTDAAGAAAAIVVAMAAVAAAAVRIWRRVAWRRPLLVVGGGARIRKRVEATQALHRAYRPPLLAVHTVAQLALHVAFPETKRVETGKHARFDREVLRLDDGGEVGFDWLADDERSTTPLAHNAPLLVLLHTITGGSHDFAGAAVLARRRGFRAVVLLRRGHLGTPLATPKFNLLGCKHDLHAQLCHIRARYPDAPITCLSSSAGTGLAVRYCGEKAEQCMIDALVCTCPGYDTTEGGAFARMHSMLGSYLLRGVRNLFLHGGNARILQEHDPEGYHACKTSATTMAEFQRNAYRFEGFESLEEYHECTNPMGVAANIKIPTLVINAEDDPVCTKQNVMDHIHLYQEENCERALALTRFGSHCCYFEGEWLLPQGSRWCDRVAVDFLCQHVRLTEAGEAEEEEAAEAQQRAISAAMM